MELPPPLGDSAYYLSHVKNNPVLRKVWSAAVKGATDVEFCKTAQTIEIRNAILELPKPVPLQVSSNLSSGITVILKYQTDCIHDESITHKENIRATMPDTNREQGFDSEDTELGRHNDNMNEDDNPVMDENQSNERNAGAEDDAMPAFHNMTADLDPISRDRASGYEPELIGQSVRNDSERTHIDGSLIVQQGGHVTGSQSDQQSGAAGGYPCAFPEAQRDRRPKVSSKSKRDLSFRPSLRSRNPSKAPEAPETASSDQALQSELRIEQRVVLSDSQQQSNQADVDASSSHGREEGFECEDTESGGYKDKQNEMDDNPVMDENQSNEPNAGVESVPPPFQNEYQEANMVFDNIDDNPVMDENQSNEPNAGVESVPPPFQNEYQEANMVFDNIDDNPVMDENQSNEPNAGVESVPPPFQNEYQEANMVFDNIMQNVPPPVPPLVLDNIPPLRRSTRPISKPPLYRGNCGVTTRRKRQRRGGNNNRSRSASPAPAAASLAHAPSGPEQASTSSNPLTNESDVPRRSSSPVPPSPVYEASGSQAIFSTPRPEIVPGRLTESPLDIQTREPEVDELVRQLFCTSLKTCESIPLEPTLKKYGKEEAAYMIYKLAVLESTGKIEIHKNSSGFKEVFRGPKYIN